MNADGKIYIIVTDKLPGGTPAPVPTNQEGDKEKRESIFSHWARNRILGLAKSTATQAVSYTLGNVGNFTGDYITQAHINDTLSNLHTLMNMGSAALAGFKVGGVAGAVVGLAAGAIGTAVTTALQVNAQRLANSRTNYEIEQLRNRAGMNPLMDGSRGTEN